MLKYPVGAFTDPVKEVELGILVLDGFLVLGTLGWYDSLFIARCLQYRFVPCPKSLSICIETITNELIPHALVSHL